MTTLQDGCTDVEVSYADAIHSALNFQLKNDPKVLICGLGVDDPKAMYGTLSEFPKLYGPNRCFDTPLSEDSLTATINAQDPYRHKHDRLSAHKYILSFFSL